MYIAARLQPDRIAGRARRVRDDGGAGLWRPEFDRAHARRTWPASRTHFRGLMRTCRRARARLCARRLCVRCAAITAKPLPAFVGTADRIEFTRTGLRQSAGRAALESASACSTNSTATRSSAASLRCSIARRQPRRRSTTLREQRRAFRLRYLDASNRWSDSWPPLRQRRCSARRPWQLPRAVEVPHRARGLRRNRASIELVSALAAATAELPCSRSSRNTCLARQRGVALLVALLVVALATVLIASLLDRGELGRARTRNQLREAQAQAYAQGLEVYAARVLQQD